MANRPAPPLVLRPGDREELERRTRSSTVPASAAKRARIVLLAADGVAYARIAELTDVVATRCCGGVVGTRSVVCGGLATSRGRVARASWIIARS